MNLDTRCPVCRYRTALDLIAHWQGPITSQSAHEMRMLARRVIDGWTHAFGPPGHPLNNEFPPGTIGHSDGLTDDMGG